MNIDTLPAEPWPLFVEWLKEAQQQEPAYPEAMTLATVGSDGMPSARTVLMKGFGDDGIVFYTNRESRKGGQLATHPKAALCFYWKSLQRQVHIEGTIAQVSDAESDAYFATRPRSSQIGAWASQQSRVLENRVMLEQRAHDFEKKYEGKIVSRPPYWGGYRLTPISFEFWQEQPYRLHDRIAYRHEGVGWVIERRYP
jgi:pyridoxamine 5'-phosphate oxidase